MLPRTAKARFYESTHPSPNQGAAHSRSGRCGVSRKILSHHSRSNTWFRTHGLERRRPPWLRGARTRIQRDTCSIPFPDLQPVIASSHTIDSADLSHQVSRTWSIVIARFMKRLISDPRYWTFLFAADCNRIFAATIIRIWLAHRTQAMRYGIFTFAK